MKTLNYNQLQFHQRMEADTNYQLRLREAAKHLQGFLELKLDQRQQQALKRNENIINNLNIKKQ